MSEAPEARPYPPEVFASYGNGWRQLWRHFLPLFLIGLIIFAISIAISLPQNIASVTTGNEMVISAFAVIWTIVTIAFSIFISGPLGYGQYYAYLKAARADNAEVGDLFAAFRENYWSAVGAGLLVGIIVTVGLFFLVVPGIYFACKLAFVPYLVVDKRMSVGKAFGESWRMASHGRAWKVFLLGLLGIPIMIVGFIVLIVGVIISTMWIYAALASLYHAIDAERNSPVEIDQSLPVNP